ncbi:hypothetical protein [Bartonella rattaustraliani]|uniref:hypothetical protein n=1 Tax=Bartonella rattaustraliani TaxID=481139 RepID=UPI0002ED8D9C|nr:hypothetical protein [Bartonella rattaustraliani]
MRQVLLASSAVVVSVVAIGVMVAGVVGNANLSVMGIVAYANSRDMFCYVGDFAVYCDWLK